MHVCVCGLGGSACRGRRELRKSINSLIRPVTSLLWLGHACRARGGRGDGHSRDCGCGCVVAGRGYMRAGGRDRSQQQQQHSII